MTNLADDQRFVRIPLEFEGLEAEFSKGNTGREMLILRDDSDGDLRLFAHEARALRDWLNKVLT